MTDVDDSGGVAGGANRTNVADECARMRARCLGTRCGDTAAEQDHRRSRCNRASGGRDERAPVAEVLEVERDRARGLVGRKLVEQVGGDEIRLVSERGEAGEAESRGDREPRELERKVAALRDEGHRTGGQRAPAEIELLACVEDPEAVGPEHHSPGRTDARRGSFLDELPFLAVLAESRADRDDRLRACAERLLDGPLEPRCGDAYDHKLRRVGQVVEREVGTLPEDLPTRPVHEVHGSPMRTAQSAASEDVAPLGRESAEAPTTANRPRARREARRAWRVHDESRRREMMRRWMSDVPSSISSSLASRIHFSTGYSRE